MPTYDELFEALRILHVYCKTHGCDKCVMSTDGITCRITEEFPAFWEFAEPRIQIWEGYNE